MKGCDGSLRLTSGQPSHDVLYYPFGDCHHRSHDWDSLRMADDKTSDGGKHDVGRDGQTGKTADQIDPKKYEDKK
jgi:hypothetical protein